MIFPPIDSSGADILTLPVKPREPVADRFLVPVPASKCGHFIGPFVVDEKGGKCTCKACGEEVSPMFVLAQLMNLESRWMRTREAYMGEMERLAKRSKTKCEHCAKLTRISHT